MARSMRAISTSIRPTSACAVSQSWLPPTAAFRRARASLWRTRSSSRVLGRLVEPPSAWTMVPPYRSAGIVPAPPPFVPATVRRRRGDDADRAQAIDDAVRRQLLGVRRLGHLEVLELRGPARLREPLLQLVARLTAHELVDDVAHRPDPGDRLVTDVPDQREQPVRADDPVELHERPLGLEPVERLRAGRRVNGR